MVCPRYFGSHDAAAAELCRALITFKPQTGGMVFDTLVNPKHSSTSATVVIENWGYPQPRDHQN